jgi:hypothetical protein
MSFYPRKTLEAGAGYRVRVSELGASSHSVVGFSPAPGFSVPVGALVLTTPAAEKAGAPWRSMPAVTAVAGRSMRLRWGSTGGARAGGYVSIELWRTDWRAPNPPVAPGAKRAICTITSTTRNDGSYFWRVPAPLESDVAPPASPPNCTHGPPSCTALALAGALQRGGNYTVRVAVTVTARCDSAGNPAPPPAPGAVAFSAPVTLNGPTLHVLAPGPLVPISPSATVPTLVAWRLTPPALQDAAETGSRRRRSYRRRRSSAPNPSAAAVPVSFTLTLWDLGPASAPRAAPLQVPMCTGAAAASSPGGSGISCQISALYNPPATSAPTPAPTPDLRRRTFSAYRRRRRTFVARRRRGAVPVRPDGQSWRVSFGWLAPAALSTATRYAIRVSYLPSGGVLLQDLGDPFVVRAGEIAVSSPCCGQSYVPGSSVSTHWSATGAAAAANGDTAQLSLLKADTGEVVIAEIACQEFMCDKPPPAAAGGGSGGGGGGVPAGGFACDATHPSLAAGSCNWVLPASVPRPYGSYAVVVRSRSAPNTINATSGLFKVTSGQCAGVVALKALIDADGDGIAGNSGGGVITDGSGGDTPYTGQMLCAWRLAAPAGAALSLTFSEFELTADDDIVVYDANFADPAKRLATFRGQGGGAAAATTRPAGWLPPPLNSSSNEMYVVFTAPADDSATSRQELGFVARFGAFRVGALTLVYPPAPPAPAAVLVVGGGGTTVGAGRMDIVWRGDAAHTGANVSVSIFRGARSGYSDSGARRCAAAAVARPAPGCPLVLAASAPNTGHLAWIVGTHYANVGGAMAAVASAPGTWALPPGDDYHVHVASTMLAAAASSAAFAVVGGSIEVLFPAEGDALYSASYETVRWNRPSGSGGGSSGGSGGGGRTVAVELFRGASPCAAEPAPTPAPAHHATPPVAPVLPERVAVLAAAAPDTGYVRSLLATYQ